jgi:diaminopimelate decarboxylase
LYTVGGVKEIPNIRTYVSVDGGMCDNIRYALYQSEYTVITANKADKPADAVVTIAGKCCESGDLIQENTTIAKAQPGDILAVLSTGAYNYSMASNYNRIQKPPIVMVKDGKARLIVKRESYEDLLRNDI